MNYPGYGEVTDYCNQVAIKAHQAKQKIAISYKYENTKWMCSVANEYED